MSTEKHALIFGATGNIGGAAARELLKRGWAVRAVTRSPESEKTLALSKLGAEIVQGDMEDQDSLQNVFDGIKRVVSVQNWTASGIEGEMRQGKLVAEAARSAEVEHLVYGSAGTGDPNTGIPHFNNKLEVEAYMRELDLPFTIVRPAPFMELLSEKEFFPALAGWGMKPKILGWNTPIPWAAVHDIGVAIANIFENPEGWIGREVELFSDIKTMSECREIFTAIDGKKPFRMPLPIVLFNKMAGDEFVQMWHWMVDWMAETGYQGLFETLENSRVVCPELLDMESWLKIKRNGGFG